jgi:hypothetical protein
MNDEKRAFNSAEPSPLDQEIEQLQELLQHLVADTSVLIYTHPKGAPGPLDPAAAWEWASAIPFQFPLQNPSLDELEDCTEYIN